MVDPRLNKRCYKRTVFVPLTLDALETEIERWIATCVMSRTKQRSGEPIHRERRLVRGNPSVAKIWSTVQGNGGIPVTIEAKYTWGAERVERIDFSLSGASAKLLKPPPPAPGPAAKAAKSPCVREMDSITMLRPWERLFLETVIDPPDKEAFASPTLWVGTRALAHPMLPIAENEKTVVFAALADPLAQAITLCPNVWFKRQLDTRIPDDLALLVHEAVHLRDCHLVGVDAYILSYLGKFIDTGNYEDIADERLARQFENATLGLLSQFPNLAQLINACDNAAIMRDLKAQRSTYTAAVYQML